MGRCWTTGPFEGRSAEIVVVAVVPVVPAGSDAMCETEAYHGAKARHSVGDQARAAPSRLYEEQTLWGLFSLGFAAAGRLYSL